MGGDPFVMEQTFKEVQGCRKAGIMINTLLLASDLLPGLSSVKEMTAMTNGKAYFANPGNLSQFVLIGFHAPKEKQSEIVIAPGGNTLPRLPRFHQ